MNWGTGRVPLAWLVLVHSKPRALVALTGVAFAVMLMLVQLGFRDALIESATLVQQNLRGQLVMIHPLSETTYRLNEIPEQRLYQAEAVHGVTSVSPLLIGLATWKNPWNGKTRPIFVMGLDPNHSAVKFKGLDGRLAELTQSDTAIFDQNSRPEFGPVEAALRAGQEVNAEIDHHHVRIAGTFAMGASFSADGNLITSLAGFRRILGLNEGALSCVAIELADGSDVREVQTRLNAALPGDVTVLTREQFVERESGFWEQSTGLGFIFGQGVFLGFVVGFVIVYQILFADVSSHLAEYATLKAIGYPNGYFLRMILEEALLLAMCGYVSGLPLTNCLFSVSRGATGLPMHLSFARCAIVLALAVVMCALSGVVAMQKLRAADPAAVF